MKINDQDIPDRFTHEEAADLFMSTAVGKSTGVTRAELLKLLHAKYPSADELSDFIRATKTQLESAMTPAAGPYTVLDHGHAIRCNTCGKTSWNSNDVLHRYCGHCKKFHEV